MADPTGCDLCSVDTGEVCCAVNDECCCEMGPAYIRELTHNSYGIIQHEAYRCRDKDIDNYVKNMCGVVAYTIEESGSSDLFKYFTVYKVSTSNHRIVKFGDLWLMVYFRDQELSDLGLPIIRTHICDVSDLVMELNLEDYDDPSYEKSVEIMNTVVIKKGVEVVGLDGEMSCKQVEIDYERRFSPFCWRMSMWNPSLLAVSVDYGCFIGSTRPVFGIVLFSSDYN